jgi:hypothetical protein
MEMDTRVLALGLVSLIVSGLAVFSLAGEEAGDPIRILNSQYPLTYDPGEEDVYSLSILARNREDVIRVDFSIMIPKRLEPVEMVDPGVVFDKSNEAGDVLANSRKYLWFSEQAASLGIEPEIYEGELRIGGRRFSLLVKDFGVLAELLGPKSVSNQPLIYGAAINETGESFYLEGFRDFFYRPASNIKSLNIVQGDEETDFVPEDQRLEGSGDLPLSSAPRGSVVFNSGQRDDILKVSFSVKVFSLPQGSYQRELAFMQFIRIYLNGEVCGDPIVNLVHEA